MAAVANGGEAVYLSTTAGTVWLTAPGTGGETFQYLGRVSVGGTGAVEVAIAISEPTIL